MAEAAQAAVSATGQVLHAVSDAGYSNGEQAELAKLKASFRMSRPIAA